MNMEVVSRKVVSPPLDTIAWIVYTFAIIVATVCLIGLVIIFFKERKQKKHHLFPTWYLPLVSEVLKEQF